MAASKANDFVRLYYDARWTGNHGIARFSKEVRSRSRLDFEDLKSCLSPTSPFDSVSLSRFKMGSKSVIYNPGFNVGFGLANQIPTLHDLILIDERNPKHKVNQLYFEKVVRPAIQKSKLVFTVSQTSKDALQEWICDTSVIVENVGNGISDIFHSQGIPGGSKQGNRILFVGNLRAHKNLLTLLDAVKKLPLVRLRLIVPISEKAELLGHLRSRSIGHRCQVDANLSDLELFDAYRESDVLAFPSTNEGFGLPVAESIAAGTPVVYSNKCKSVAEIAQGFGVGVDSAMNPDEWTAAIESQLASSRTIEPPDEWRSRYLWRRVAGNVDSHLGDWLSNRQGARP